MRAVNLIPEELRPRVPGDGDPRVAYAVLGGLAVALVMVLVSISFSNKLNTIEDETAAITAETQTHQAAVSTVATTPDEIGADVKSRTLLVGGLAKTRFPWGDALGDLSKAIPSDTTLNTISVSSGASTEGGGTAGATGGATMTLAGCTSSWVGYSRFMTWLKTMPGVEKVASTSSAVAASAEGSAESDKRVKNCGPAPLTFGVLVTYAPRTIDLLGLPKPESATTPAGATGSTGSTAGGVPAASSTPPATPAPAAAGGQ